MIPFANYDRKIFSLGKKNHYAMATLEVTKRCNGRCDYCYVAENESRDGTTQQIVQILDKLARAGVMHLTITGGEPFIRDDIQTILSAIIEKDFWKIALFTNGTLVKKQHIAFMERHQEYFGMVQLTVFSHLAEIHDAYMGIPGSLKQIINVARQLREAGILVIFALNAIDVNYSTISDTIEYFESLGFSIRFGLNKIISPLKGGKRQQNLQRLQRMTDFDFYCQVLHSLPPGFLIEEKKQFNNEEKTKSNDDLLFCRGVIFSLYIDSEGYIKPCSSFQNLTIGNILDPGSLFDIVNKSEVLRRLKSLRRSDLDLCRTCKYIKSCNLCIGAIHTESGQFQQPSAQFCSYAQAVEGK